MPELLQCFEFLHPIPRREKMILTKEEIALIELLRELQKAKQRIVDLMEEMSKPTILRVPLIPPNHFEKEGEKP